MKQIASCISDRDNNVRNAAINAVVAAWKEEGDRIYQLIGKMSDKERVMLDERIKRSAVVTKNKGSFYFMDIFYYLIYCWSMFLDCNAIIKSTWC